MRPSTILKYQPDRRSCVPRSAIQTSFTPTVPFDAAPTPRLVPGDTRIHTSLKIFIEFSDTVELQIPTREPSKDWQYDPATSSSVVNLATRPFGWFVVEAGPGSTFTYLLPTVAAKDGFDSLLEVHLDTVAISSSINYRKFLRAETCRVGISIPSDRIAHLKCPYVFYCRYTASFPRHLNGTL